MKALLTQIDYLQPGDVIDIVAPSAKCHPSVLGKISELVNSWGLKCRIPDDIFGESLLYANSDEKRFLHLKDALLNDESKLVWCLLGGYGSTKLIPMLSKLKPPPKSKIFIGFSDITALHIFLQGQWGWPTIHGPSGYQTSLNKVSTDSISLLKQLIFNKGLPRYDQIIPLNSRAMNHSTISAPIIGGNLHLIQASLGTSWQINADDKILFIEEINERAYRIDRVLAHLSQAGILDDTKAILFGDMIDKGEPDNRFLVDETIREFAHQCTIPVLQIKNIGHGTMNNPIVMGYPATLSMGNHYTLEFNL